MGAFSKKKVKAPILPQPIDAYSQSIAGLTGISDQFQRLSAADIRNQLELNRLYGPDAYNQQIDFTNRFGGQLAQAESNVITERLRANAANIASMGTSLQDAMALADPATERIRAELAGQRFSDLQAGGGLTDLERRGVQQGVRQAQGARGITQGMAPVAEEALFGAREMKSNRSRVQNAAEQFLHTQKSTQFNPADIILGTGRMAPTFISPNVKSNAAAPYVSNLQEQQFQRNTDQASMNAKAAAENAKGGGGLGTLGAIGGGILGSFVGMPHLGAAIGGGLGGGAGGGGWAGAAKGAIGGYTMAGGGGFGAAAAQTRGLVDKLTSFGRPPLYGPGFG